ncbi:MAG: FliM/FliN family flagellar motor switch protein [Candidatus Eisenbacteria bacterium]
MTAKEPVVVVGGEGGTQERYGSGSGLESLLDVSMTVAVEIGRANVTVQEVLQLGPGSVVPLSRMVGDPVDVFVGDKKFAQGDVVVVGEHFGVRITRIIAPPPQEAQS